MPDALTTRMDALWPKLVKAFKSGQSEYPLSPALRVETNESASSSRIRTPTWDDSDDLVEPNEGADRALMWRRETVLAPLSADEGKMVSDVKVFAKEWAKRYRLATLRYIGERAPTQNLRPSLAALRSEAGNFDASVRLVCGRGIPGVLDDETQEYFEKVEKLPELAPFRCFIIPISDGGPWVDELEADAVFSWASVDGEAHLTASRRLYVNDANDCFHFEPPT